MPARPHAKRADAALNPPGTALSLLSPSKKGRPLAGAALSSNSLVSPPQPARHRAQRSLADCGASGCAVDQLTQLTHHDHHAQRESHNQKFHFLFPVEVASAIIREYPNYVSSYPRHFVHSVMLGCAKAHVRAFLGQKRQGDRLYMGENQSPEEFTFRPETFAAYRPIHFDRCLVPRFIPRFQLPCHPCSPFPQPSPNESVCPLKTGCPAARRTPAPRIQPKADSLNLSTLLAGR